MAEDAQSRPAWGSAGAGPASDAQLPSDWGLRCPHCDYNLTGLPEPRCPECGTVFRWEDVGPAPRIAFERTRGWARIGGFVLTALTVLFAPWIFARQIVQRVRGRAALLFAAVCFAATVGEPLLELGILGNASASTYLLWLGTAGAYIVIQAAGLTLLDRGRAGWPGEALRFWLAAGCYTSAIMLTEFIGPPMLLIDELVAALRGRSAWVVISEDMLNATPMGVVQWVQIGLWIGGVACCYYARRRQRRVGRGWALAGSAGVALGALVLYATAVRYVGAELYMLVN